MKNSQWFAATMALVVAVLACNIPSGEGGNILMEETRVALAIQQTGIAIQQATLDADFPALTVPPLAATYTPYPTYTPVVSSGVVTDAPPPQQIHEDMDALIKASNILIYEDVVGDPTLVPVVGNTVSAMRFSGGKVINTGDAMGRFREHANSATPWDLIIVAAEARSGFSGELFEMLYDHIDNGGAVIIEIWYLDRVSQGKISPILNDCGVRLFRDWERGTNYDPYKYSIYWLDTSHPLLSTPNTVQAPSYPYPEWFGDAGDLLELGSGGDAVLVGGLYPNRNSDYGVLTSCMGGRMVIQTFSSHDYNLDLIQALWENYITYTLTKHYEYVD
jgi:hypothetical protein